MAKFVMECPSCGKYVEAKSGFFAKKKIDCSCGHVINIRAEKLTSRTCAHCGNEVVFDQTKGANAKCPVCGEPINTLAEQDKTIEFSCAQCGIRLHTTKGATKYECPVCDHVNNVVERLETEKIKRDDLASIIKYEGDADTLVWKHPVEDFNMGSQLIVHESQVAIFFRDGQALDPLPSGSYLLEPQRLNILSKLYKHPNNPQSGLHSEVYFFNLINQMAIKWGTPEKINFLEPMTGAPISLGARGMLNLRIADARKLLLKLVGTGGKLTRQDLMDESEGNIRNYFRNLVQLTVATNLAGIITGENMDILQIDQQKMRLSACMLDALKPGFEDYGLEITEFVILGIALPKSKDEVGFDVLQRIMKMRQKDLTLAEMETQKQIDVREQENIAEVKMAERKVVAQEGETSLLKTQYEVQAERMQMQLEMERKAQIAQIEAEEMRLKGYNQKDVMQADVQKAYAGALGQMGANGGGGSALGDVATLGVTLGAMGGVIGMTKEAMSPMNMNNAQTLGWNCTCGQQNIASNFCPNCGNKKPELKAADTWDCPNCGNKGITAKFCGECGAKKPESTTWDCPECGTKGISAKFCGNCGAKKPEKITWDCPGCGNKGITAKFCGECGYKREG